MVAQKGSGQTAAPGHLLVQKPGEPKAELKISVWNGNRTIMVSENYRMFVLEQLARVVPVTGKSMFGGVGLYARGLFFALIAEDRLYFKVDDRTRTDFERRGMEPFRPFDDKGAMGYYEVPADVLEDAGQLASWVEQAIAVAAGAKKPARKNHANRKRPRGHSRPTKS
jgi:DNA transformation protein